MIKENVEIVGSVDIADDIKRKVQTTGVRGLDIEKAQEYGIFQRIANLLCVQKCPNTQKKNLKSLCREPLSL